MYRTVVIGVGPHPDSSHAGYSMGYRHADGYQSIDGCELVGCADIVEKHATAFGEQYGLDTEATFEDHTKLIESVEPDIVSICTPPGVHPQIVSDCTKYPSTRAIHCEKPIAETWRESQDLVEACREQDVQITINLQNRFHPTVQAAKDYINAGKIGNIERIEIRRHDLLQRGLHNIDVANYLTGDKPVEWVLGGIDYRQESKSYTDMYLEDQSIALWEYKNGIEGLAITGSLSGKSARNEINVKGTDGEVVVSWGDPSTKVRVGRAKWDHLDLDDSDPQAAALRDVVNALNSGRSPMLDAERALSATEIVFGIWESSRQRGRVDLPLSIEDNPLKTLIEDH